MQRSEPARKKRKLNGVNGISKISSDASYSTSRDVLQQRQRLFHDFWRQKSAQFGALISDLDEAILNELTEFVSTRIFTNSDDRLQTAILLTGVESTVYEQTIEHLRHATRRSGVVANLQSHQCPNLQSSLKAIVKTVIVEHAGFDAYEEHLSRHKRLLPLNFDLELLELFANEQSISRIAISFSEVERFNGQMLNELIDTLHSWQKRIPFVLLLEVTSTAELLEFRLSKACLNSISAQQFNFGSSEDPRFPFLVQMQSEVGHGPKIFLGPSLVTSVFDRTQDQGKTAQSVTCTLEHAYMSHFYTNAVAILSGKDNEVDVRYLSEAIRRTESFRQFCEGLLELSDKESVERVRKLLNEDDFLVEEARTKVTEGQRIYTKTCQLIEACSDLYQCVAQGNQDLHQPKIEVALDLYRSIENLVESDTFLALETALSSTTASGLQTICTNLKPSTHRLIVSDELRETLRQEAQTEDGAVSNGVGIHVSGASTHLPSTAVKLTKTSKKSAGIVSEFAKAMLIETLRDQLNLASMDVSQLFLHEAYILSSRAVRPRQGFESTPRSAVERALLMPGDYLGCECVNRAQETDHENETVQGYSSQHGRPPPASTVYTLLQEAPTNINLRDLFDAFSSRCEPDLSTPVEIQSSEEADSETIKALLAQFYRALAELRLSGLVKTSTGTQIKKRIAGRNAKMSSTDIDYIAKTSWVGM